MILCIWLSFRTTVPFWGTTQSNSKQLVPEKRDYGPKRVSVSRIFCREEIYGMGPAKKKKTHANVL